MRGETAWGGKTSDQVHEPSFVEAVPREELREGALNPESGQDGGCTVSWWGGQRPEYAHIDLETLQTWANDENHLLVFLLDEHVQVGVGENQSRAGSPVSE